MSTLRNWSQGSLSIPPAALWAVERVGLARGRQDLFTRQSPQRLRALREHAVVESTVSSNRIEGIEVDRPRVGTLVFGRSAPRDRNEEELQGYRRALEWIHGEADSIPLDTPTLLELHRRVRGELWDSGRFKDQDGEIVERYPDGRQRVRFRPVTAAATPDAVTELLALHHRSQVEAWVPAPVALAAFNLDLLCIHPFRDGNGRVSRLILLLSCYHAGLEVGRYISLERLVEQRKDEYYGTLETSSQGWHEGRHDPWPYVLFILSLLREAYQELEARLGALTLPRGEKRGRVLAWVELQERSFSLEDLRRGCPGVGDDMLRKVLKELRAQGRVTCLGRGVRARWSRGNQVLPG